MAINLNIAACYLQLKNYDYAIEVCKRALDRDSSSVKAYYRLGQAYLETGDYIQGIQFVKVGLQVSTETPFFLITFVHHAVLNSTKQTTLL